jgi:phosphotriesterase-related protein
MSWHSEDSKRSHVPKGDPERAHVKGGDDADKPIDGGEPAAVEEGGLDRRALLVRSAGALAVAGIAAGGLAGYFAGPAEGETGAAEPDGTLGGQSVDNLVLETVTGPIRGRQVNWALEHEHLFVDFRGAKDPAYMDVDWSNVTGACVNSVSELRGQGVDLFVEYTPMGVGRNALLHRDVSRQTGMNILCASGIYRASFGIPPEFRDMSIADVAAHFVRELTLGVDGTHIRAGFIKIAVDDDGPKAADLRTYRAAARAANATGCAIGVHAPVLDAFKAVLRVLESEGLNLSRLIWAHAEYTGTVDDYKQMARRGIFVSWDAVTVGGVPGDDVQLDWIAALNEEGLLGKALISTDSTIASSPQGSQYGYQNTYLFRTFKPKLVARFGDAVARTLLRDNVIRAYRRGANVM